ncbi:alpha-N-acetylgalactosaminide alpha-2,6-sialyltransferase 1-like isoform X1 [Anguilla anguilla]|uniref:alpha-N-acetylgalactosaminide alpha-2,6-sialyltransferase 1-like isoform X1 n=2 Tax=Anguilla anguilla TaxID=7936 RepID=UPI0015AA3AC4|nr:alpha-N-acetylgalactosaminide alpha-2,6-sialyltransferase 1-like isoform X1 [Anguilla anguilla]
MIHRRLLRPALAVALCVFFYAFIWTNLPLQFKKQTNSKAGSVTAQNETSKAAEMDDKHQYFTRNLSEDKTPSNITDEKQRSISIGSTAIKLAKKTNSSVTRILTSKVTKAKVYQTSAGHITTGDDNTGKMVNMTAIPPLDINSFVKAPEWGFEDTYVRDPHPRKTTCQQSLRNSKDEEFQKSFIPDIQLFMQKNHLNLSVWNKLAHFNNPFGFMGYNYSVVQDSVKLIPDLKDFQLLPVPPTDKEGCIRCAVVGTGGILNGSRKGKEIDSHDYVFRVNGAVLKGFEEDVGNKTSVYVHTAHSLTSARPTLKQYGFTDIPADEGIKYVFIPEGLRDYYWLQGLYQKTKVPGGQFRNYRPLRNYPANFDVSKFYVLHPDFLRYVRIRFMLSKQLHGRHWRHYRPTNGAFTMFLALQTCDIVDAYGFITADHAKYSNYYYERFSKTRVIFFINHDYSLEIKTWKRLHDANIIRLYQGKEDTQKNGDKI